MLVSSAQGMQVCGQDGRAAAWLAGTRASQRLLIKYAKVPRKPTCCQAEAFKPEAQPAGAHAHHHLLPQASQQLAYASSSRKAVSKTEYSGLPEHWRPHLNTSTVVLPVPLRPSSRMLEGGRGTISMMRISASLTLDDNAAAQAMGQVQAMQKKATHITTAPHALRVLVRHGSQY